MSKTPEPLRKRTLYLCPTPIGNLEDITLRVLYILGEADIVGAESVKVTKKLLSRYDLHPRLVSYRESNRESGSQAIIKALEDGNIVALVSDSGTPGISDPGVDLIGRVLDAGFEVDVLPGPSALLPGLLLSGLPAEPFIFYGFLSPNKKKRRQTLEEISNSRYTVILYEAPHRISKTLSDLGELCPSRRCALVRELTKIHQEVIRGTVKEVFQAEFEKRGEMVLVIAGDPETGMKEESKKVISGGMSRRDAAKILEENFNIPRQKFLRLLEGK